MAGWRWVTDRLSSQDDEWVFLGCYPACATLDLVKGLTVTATALEATLPEVADVGALSQQLATLTFRGFTSVIRAINTETQRRAVSGLINSRYAWRGYGSGFTVEESPGQMTLAASDYPRDTPIGTLTVRLDREDGLLADHLYPSEVQRLRTEGRRLCEIVKFAVEGSINCKHLLAALFHVAFIFARRVNKCSDLLIEVNPRHAAFYCRLLQFEPLGEERLSARVNAHAVLLRLDLDYANQQVRRLGGQGGSLSQRSLYPYAFSPIEEKAIWKRMRTARSRWPRDLRARAARLNVAALEKES